MQVWLSFKMLLCSTLGMKLKNGFLQLYCHIKQRRTINFQEFWQQLIDKVD